MKPTKLMAIATILLLGVSAATAQSLGDYARQVRKNKTETSSASHHYDNDNLPSGGELSVVGPASASADTQSPKAPAVDPPAAGERQQAADEMTKKLQKQKEKLDSLNHELDLQQREERLREAAFYADAGNRLRNSAQWDKDQAQYKNDIDSKQKAIESARQQLDDLQEQARKAGIQQKDPDKSSGENKDTSKDNNK